MLAMTKKTQVAKNIQLSAKLTEYLLENPSVVKSSPADSSYVVFSAEDEKLNKMNSKLVDKLVKEGKTVIKAEETKNSKKPWKLFSVTP